ncbi:MAG: hypothetical protein Q9221_009189 [Calogaya cf. arnoldii]
MSWSESDGWAQHSYGLIEADQSHGFLSRSPDVELASNILSDKTLQERDAHQAYSLLHANYGVNYGPTFRIMVNLKQTPGVTVQTLTLRQLDTDAYTLPEVSLVVVDNMVHIPRLQLVKGPKETFIMEVWRRNKTSGMGMTHSR